MGLLMASRRRIDGRTSHHLCSPALLRLIRRSAGEPLSVIVISSAANGQTMPAIFVSVFFSAERLVYGAHLLTNRRRIRVQLAGRHPFGVRMYYNTYI